MCMGRLCARGVYAWRACSPWAGGSLAFCGARLPVGLSRRYEPFSSRLRLGERRAMNASAPSPDLLLARRAAAGRADAWEELLAQYSERFYNLAVHFAGAGADAEDLTQEICLRLYQNLRQYRGDVPLAAWALRLSRNLCIDHYRCARRERRTSAVSEEVLAALPAGGEDPQAAALS